MLRPLRSTLVLASLAAASAQDVGDVFSPSTFQTSDASVGQALALRVADMDGDGADDVVAAVNGGGVRVFRSLGDLTLAAPTIAPVGANRGLDVGDLDGDGHLDVVTAAGGESVSVLLGLGDGTFAPAGSAPTSAGASRPELVDLDGDGVLDIAVPCRESVRVSILLGHGDGTFTSMPDVGPTGAGAFELEAGDLDGDGTVDLVVSNFDANSITFLFGDGDGTFGAPVDTTLFGAPSALALGDLDGDLDLDLAIAVLGDARILAGAGDGTFTEAAALPLASGADGLLLRDVDEDGVLDVVGTGPGGSVSVHLGHGDLTFAARLLFGGDASTNRLALGDLDVDGDLDIVTAGSTVNTLSVLGGHGDGTFAPLAVVGARPTDIALADLDENGLLDVVTANESGDSVSVLLNLGRSRFAQQLELPGPTAPRQVVAADFDLDGRVDVAVTSSGFSGGRLWVYPGAGDGTFGAPVETVVAHDSTALAVGELDGLPGPDVVVTSNALKIVQLLFNDGAGGFAAPVSLPGPLATTGVALGDWDGDGDVDLAVAADASPATLSLYANDGSGAFAPAVTTPSHGAEHFVASADVDADGDLDLVTCGPFTGVATVLLGHGDGTFAAPTSYGPLQNPAQVAVADVDADGAPDLLVAEEVRFFDDGFVSVLFGAGDGTFAAPQRVRVGRDPLGVATGDLDGDGVADAAVAVAVAGYVAVLASRQGPWTDLGEPLAGTLGLPRQVGEGTLEAGEPFRFTLTDATPSTTAFHVVGLSQISAPLKGGVLVPSLDFVNGLVTTDASGTLVIEGPWIGAPSGLLLTFQFWMVDPAGIKGFAASNAVSAEMP